MPTPAPPRPAPLFPGWDTPKGPMPPIWAWKAYVTRTTIIQSSITTRRPLTDIPAGIIGMVYYHSAPGEVPILRTIDAGDQRPYTFYLPDGTTRTATTVISATTYNQFISAFETQDAYPA